MSETAIDPSGATIIEIDVRDELEELIVERWRCYGDEGNGPECPAASPCPACENRKVALSLINHRFAIKDVRTKQEE